jgi:hypothetical protein
MGTKFNKVFSSYAPRQVAEWRVNRRFGDHLCLYHQQRDFAGSNFPDDKDRKVPPNFDLMAIESTDVDTSHTILIYQFISKYPSLPHF